MGLLKYWHKVYQGHLSLSFITHLGKGEYMTFAVILKSKTTMKISVVFQTHI